MRTAACEHTGVGSTHAWMFERMFHTGQQSHRGTQDDRHPLAVWGLLAHVCTHNCVCPHERRGFPSTHKQAGPPWDCFRTLSKRPVYLGGIS